jgi:hypothetical protein
MGDDTAAAHHTYFPILREGCPLTWAAPIQPAEVKAMGLKQRVRARTAQPPAPCRACR